MTSSLPTFPAPNESPLETCLRLRDLAPVVEVEFPGGVAGYLALTHDAVREILAGDNVTFARDPRHWPALHDGTIPPDWPLRAVVQGEHLSTKDGRDHRRLRALISKAFTPGRVRALEPRVQQIVDELLDDVVAAGDGVDLVPAFTEALPMAVICELFGVPEPDRARLRHWTAVLLAHNTSPQDAFAAQNGLMGYLRALVEQKERVPGLDLTSGLVRARESDDRLTTDELISVLWIMLVAGHETTVHMLGYAILALSQHPDQLELAKAGDRWADVVEETVRYRHSVMMTSWRFALTDVDIAGVAVPRGSAVGVVYQACGIDPAEYGETANEFDITRAQRAGHLGFGHGPRYCIGAGLARLEGRLALRSLYRRAPNPKVLIDPKEVAYSPSFFTIGPLSIPVALGRPGS
ncbi:cytochrome P450 family protein [Nocardia blacklockiae]|uniref:cytochrome P450 family protein n=1 Tax=Nocardia blacklockiae TaxID=480036 RepID=UPI0018947A4D|nr:cytochrome P450 [Nocardia blacklockiae]MBF6175763.1 cytochrome P450 [Nocardia blacklockiae]